MAEQYITLMEAAELEGIKYNSLAHNVKRNQTIYKTITEKTARGGKERVMIAISSLSKQARNAYKERLKLQELSEVAEGNYLEVNLEAVPWYVNADLEWYIENYKDSYFKAVELSNLIREFLQYSDKDRTLYAEEFAQKHLAKGQRTLYRYTKSYLEASAWANKKEKQDGSNYDFYKVLSLCRKPKAVGMFPSFTPECKQVIKNIWFNEDFARNQGTREMLYEKLQAVADINNWNKIPSYQSVARYITYLMDDEKMSNAWFLASKGMREYKNKVMVKASRDTSQLKVMEMVMGDEHTFDCWVSYKHPNGKITAIKPKLVAWIDTRSRALLGDVICKDPNSDILKQSLLKMIYSEVGGVPEYIYIDNGKDYTGQAMTGQKRNIRSSTVNEDLQFDDTTKGFYQSIGIKDYHRALPYEPWSKGQIERFFGSVCDGFTRWITSYTGTLTGSRTDAKVNKEINKMLEAGKLLTMEEFYEEWSKWLNKNYMNEKHTTLTKLKEKYVKPYDLFMNGERYMKAPPPKSYATMLMMKSENAFVRNIGIKKWNREYRADELTPYINDYVDIKYDPQDITRLYVFDKKGRFICEALNQELLLIAPKVSQKALEEHIKSQKRQIARDKQILEDARKPLEEINEEYTSFNPVTGGIDLMISGAGKKKAKVVSMPQDKTYTQNSSMRNMNEEEHVESEYMARNAESALKKLRVMNS